MRWQCRTLLLMAGVAAVPAAAAIQDNDPGDAIVVTGQTIRKAREESAAYVRELGVVRGEEQAARWLTPICPKVVGVGEPHAANATRQIRDLIREIRAPLAPDTCKANLVVAITSDPKAFMETVARKGRDKLAITPQRSGRDFLLGDAPARWWYDTSIKSRDNIASQSDLGPQVVAATDEKAPGGASAAVVPGATDTVGTHQYSASLIRTPTVRAISAATIVVDFQYARAYGLRAVIDHAALVGLAEIRPEAVPDNSILSLYTLDNARRELTGRDFSFLAGLYRIPMDREANLQRTALVNQMTGSNRQAAPQRED